MKNRLLSSCVLLVSAAVCFVVAWSTGKAAADTYYGCYRCQASRPYVQWCSSVGNEETGRTNCESGRDLIGFGSWCNLSGDQCFNVIVGGGGGGGTGGSGGGGTCTVAAGSGCPAFCTSCEYYYY